MNKCPSCGKECTRSYCSISCFAKTRTGNKNPFFGKSHNDSVKEKLRRMAKLRVNPMMGKHHSDKAKEKMSLLKEGIYDGNKNPRWKGGQKIDPCGYRYIYCPEHPRNSKNYVHEHILVMENKIGRYLLPTEIVHHIDGDKLNNSEDNLKLFSSNSEHSKEHAIIRSMKKRKRYVV